MRTLNKYELEHVSGGNILAVFAVAATGYVITKMADEAWEWIAQSLGFRAGQQSTVTVSDPIPVLETLSAACDSFSVSYDAGGQLTSASGQGCKNPYPKELIDDAF